MAVKIADAREEYLKNRELKEEDVITLLEWAQKQPHLPALTELQLILFLQSCYFKLEATKATIDTFYTLKTHCPEFFTNRSPSCASVKQMMDVCLYAPLPKPTRENYRVIYCRTMDPDASKYNFSEQFKGFDMNIMLWLMQEGTAEGLVIVTDMKLVHFGHMAKVSVMTMKKYLYYLQEGLPVRLVGLHFINVVPFMDKIMTLMKPFMKKELLDVLHLHTESIESLYKYVPQECMPKDFGGTADTIAELHASMKRRLMENSQYFEEEEKLVVDESKRPGKPKNIGDIFGVEGTFKKLDID